mgnify:CR=1 FL=1
MDTRLTSLLGCRYPIIQTAMGWVADARLVAATGNAGGFGFLAGAVMTPDEIERGIADIKSMSDAPFGVTIRAAPTPAATPRKRLSILSRRLHFCAPLTERTVT